MSEDEAHLQLIFAGRVQGVGFRDGVRRKAMRLSLRGTVKNLSDGTVEAHVQGSRNTIKTLVSELNKDYQITQITTHEVPRTGNFSSFDIIF